MSLDVTPGMPSSPGAGPPTPLAGAVAAGPPGADVNAVFAALLASQGQTTSATVPAQAAAASPPSFLGAPPATQDDEPKTEREKKEAADPNEQTLAVNWLPMPAPLPTQTPPVPIIQTALSASDTPPVRAAVSQIEVMDTVPAPTSPAPAGKADLPNSELLPISSALPVSTTTAAEIETRAVTPTVSALMPNAVPLPAASVTSQTEAWPISAVPPNAVPQVASVAQADGVSFASAAAASRLTSAVTSFSADGNAPSTTSAGQSWASSAQPSVFQFASAVPNIQPTTVIGQPSVARPAMTFDSTVALTPQAAVSTVPIISPVARAVPALGAPISASPQTTDANVPASLVPNASLLEPVQMAVAPVLPIVSSEQSPIPVPAASTSVPASAVMVQLSLPAASAGSLPSQVQGQTRVTQSTPGLSIQPELGQLSDTSQAPSAAPVVSQYQASINAAPTPSSSYVGDIPQTLQTAAVLEVMPTTQITPAPTTTPVSQALPAATTLAAPQRLSAAPMIVVPQAAPISQPVAPPTVSGLSLPSGNAQSPAQSPAPSMPASSVAAQNTLENSPETANNTSSSGISAPVQTPVNPAGLKRPVVLPETSVPVAPAKGTPTSPIAALAPGGVPAPAKDADEQTKTNDEDAEPSATPWAAGLTPRLDQNAPSAGNVASAGPVTREDRAQMMHQVADAVGALQQKTAPGGESQMSLKLHPKEWGEMQVSVRMLPTRDADGVPTTAIVAHIVASNPAVKTALEAHSSELHRTLQEAGLRLDRLTVTVQSTAASGQAHTAAGDGQPSFSGNRSDQWQAAQSQTNGNAASSGNSANFSAFSEGRQGRSFTGQQTAAAYGTADDAELETFSAVGRPVRANAGFDQRV